MVEHTVRTALDAIEDALSRDERGDALAILQNTRDVLTVESEPNTAKGKSIADRVHQVREDLFGTTAIADIAKRTVSPDKDWYLRQALDVVVAQLDAACTALELVAADAREPQDESSAGDADAIQNAKEVLPAETPAPNAAFTLTRASDTLEAIDALINVSMSVLRSGADLGDDLAVVLDGAYEKIVSARGDVDAVLDSLGGMP